MPAGTLISEEEYLRSTFEPDAEYVNGKVVERHLGELPHAWLQSLFVACCLRHRRQWNITAAVELRIRIGPGVYRIPDVCIYEGELTERVPSRPPLLWVEILSPEDRLLAVNRKVRELLAAGCPYVWVIDPETLESELHGPGQAARPVEDRVLRLPGTSIEIPLERLEE